MYFSAHCSVFLGAVQSSMSPGISHVPISKILQLVPAILQSQNSSFFFVHSIKKQKCLKEESGGLSSEPRLEEVRAIPVSNINLLITYPFSICEV